MANSELIEALQALAHERKIDEFYLIERLEASLAKSYQHILDLEWDARVTIDRQTGKIYVYELVPVGEPDPETGEYAEFTERDVVGTVLTDSAVMYGSRIQELNEQYGAYTEQAAELDHNIHMLALKTDNLMELTYNDRKRVHNLKYYTWVEQQGKTSEELNALWYDTEGTWDAVHAQAKELDELINAFNDATGLLKSL